MIAWNFQRIVGTCQFRVPWFGYPCGYSSLTFEQLNLSSITKFALTYAGITTVSELKEYNYISLANVLPLSFLIRRIFLPINISSCFIFCSIPFHHAYEPILVLFALFYAICMMKRDLF